MRDKLEYILNFVLGIILFNNLYFFSHLIFLPSNLLLTGCLLISLYYFLKHFDLKVYLSLLNNWNVMFYFIFSIIFLVIDYLLNTRSPNFNDLIRVLIYSLYFSWTFQLFKDFEGIKKYLFRICITSLIILFIEGLIEINAPFAFSLFLPPGYEKKMSRVGGTLIDATSFAVMVVIYLAMILYDLKIKSGFRKIIFVVLLLSLCFYLVEISGSRLGFMLYFLVFLFYVAPLFKRNILPYLLGFSLLIFFMVFVFQTQLVQYARENPDSSFSRFAFAKDNTHSSQSTFAREVSLIGGLEYIKSNYFIYGPGSCNYVQAYGEFQNWEKALPHNGFIFLGGQYGILFLVFVYLIFLLAKRAFKSGTFVFFLIFIIQFNIMPNCNYYCSVFLLWFFIDTVYLLKSDSKIELSLKTQASKISQG